MEKAPLRLPYDLARRGQWFGLLALVFMLGLTGYAIYADHPWVAGILGVLDFVGIVLAFQRSGSKSEDDGGPTS